MPPEETRGEATRTSHEERLATVEEHVEQKNRHDIDGIISTFGEQP